MRIYESTNLRINEPRPSSQNQRVSPFVYSSIRLFVYSSIRLFVYSSIRAFENPR